MSRNFWMSLIECISGPRIAIRAFSIRGFGYSRTQYCK